MRDPIALILLASSVSGCMGSGLKSWRVQTPSPAQVVTQQHPQRIRISRADNTKIVVRNPSVIGDSLVAVDAADRRIALPLTEVRQLEVEKTDGGKVIVVVIATAAGVAYLISLLGKAASAGY